jgi:hypothetical protein
MNWNACKCVTYNLLACVSICNSVVILDVAHDHRLYIYYTLLKYLTSDIHMHMIYYIIYLIFANNSHVVHSHAQVEHPHQTQWMHDHGYNCSVTPVPQDSLPRVTWSLVAWLQQQQQRSELVLCCSHILACAWAQILSRSWKSPDNLHHTTLCSASSSAHWKFDTVHLGYIQNISNVENM